MTVNSIDFWPTNTYLKMQFWSHLFFIDLFRSKVNFYWKQMTKSISADDCGQVFESLRQGQGFCLNTFFDFYLKTNRYRLDKSNWFLEWTFPRLFLFSILLCSQQSLIANDWIWTEILLSLKQLLCHLCHNHNSKNNCLAGIFLLKMYYYFSGE